MSLAGVACGLPVLGIVSFVAWRFLRNKGRKVHFACTACGLRETHYERQIDVRAALAPVCGRCRGAQTIEVEGDDTTADIETFGRSAAEAGSLVVCGCGTRHVVPGECAVTAFGPDGQSVWNVRPVMCPRCGTQHLMRRPQGAPAQQERPEGECACGVTPAPLRRGVVLRCPTCQQRQARVLLMS